MAAALVEVRGTEEGFLRGLSHGTGRLKVAPKAAGAEVMSRFASPAILVQRVFVNVSVLIPVESGNRTGYAPIVLCVKMKVVPVVPKSKVFAAKIEVV